MADAFDPYREALVMETETLWPEDVSDVPMVDRPLLAARLHEQPADAANLEYVRTHSGFARRITVTPDDLARVAR